MRNLTNKMHNRKKRNNNNNNKMNLEQTYKIS